MVLSSFYPDPPALGDVNIHDFCFNRPDQATWGEHTCYVDCTGTTYTVKQFKNRALQGATALSTELGLHPGCGETVGVLSHNSIDYGTLLHSLLVLTVPFALFSHQSTQFELRHAWTNSGTTRVFVDPKLLPLALAVAKDLGIDKNRIHILDGKGVPDHSSFEDLLRSSEGRPLVKPSPVNRTTLAYLIMSSGTSGLPKCVKISHRNVVYSMLQALVTGAEALKLTGPRTWNTPQNIPVMVGFLPMAHSYGLHICCFRTFLAPLTFVVIPKWDAKVVLQAIAKYRVTHLPLVPSIAVAMVSNPDMLRGTDLSSIVAVSCGAAYLPPEIAENIPEVLKQPTDVTEGYGMSETTISAILKPTVDGVLNGKGRIIKGSAGILLPGMKARIIKDDGTEAGPKEPGELWLQGDNVVEGYLNDPKATSETFVDGWLRTGDRFSIDEKGNYFFADRVKDTLKVSGIQVSPVEIEDVLLGHPEKYILDVTVAGVSGGRTADERVPRAWVVLSHKGETLGGKEVVKALDVWVKKNLSKYKWLRGGFQIVDQIPKSTNGKVLRKVLQEQYERARTQARL